MKNLILILFINITVVFIVNGQKNKAPNYFEIKKKWEERILKEKQENQNLKFEEDGDESNFWRWSNFWRFRLSENGDMNDESELFNAVRKKNYNIRKDIQNRNNCDPSIDDYINWVNLGPFNSQGAKTGAHNCYSSGGAPNKQNQGRIESISVDPDNSNNILIGGLNGGIWKTTTGGSNWSNVTDDEGFSQYGATSIIRHPENSNIVYALLSVGGGLWESKRSIYGNGVIVSTDGGDSWQETGISNILLSEIAIDPNSTLQNTRLFVTSAPKVYKWEGNYMANGTWSSIATNWGWWNGPLWYGQVNYNDIEVDALGTVWFSNFEGLFKYINGNASKVDNYIIPAPYNSTQTCGSPAQTLRSHMSIEINKQNHIVLLVVFNNCTNGEKKYLYKSVDGGNSWTYPKDVSSNVYHNSSNKYPMIAVSPYNSDTIFVESFGRCMKVSNDFGISFSNMNNTQNHVDIRTIIAYSGSGNNDDIYIGTDGGISTTTNNYNWVDITGQDLSLTNYYGCGISEYDDKIIFAGAQDGSINYYTNGSWYETNPGGDNGDCMINPYDNNMIFQESQNNIYKGTLQNNDVIYNTVFNQYGGWMNPLHWNPSKTNEFFVGIKKLYRGITTSSSLLEIYNSNLHGNNKDISSVVVSRNNPDIVYYSTDNYFYKTGAPIDDGIYKATRYGGLWTVSDITGSLRSKCINGFCGLPQALTDITVDPNNENRIWVTMAGFLIDKKVFYSSNSGNTWQNITLTGLPNLPCTAISFQELSNDRLYVGTDNGIYFKDNNMTCWAKYGNNDPQCMINDLEINQCAGKLVAATFGRGLWEAPLIINPEYIFASGITVWDSPKTVSNNLRIPNGSTLKIQNTTINMGKDTKIVIETGGKLEISNSTLTNTCGYTWGGIEVLGNSYNTQTYANQGAVIVDYSTIEHAVTAIKVGSGTSQNGGIVKATESNFYNNKKSIEYFKYDYENSGRFDLCTFKTDNNYRHSASLLGHITMWAVHGIKINGCTFENSKNWAFNLSRVHGITAIDADYRIDRYCYGPLSSCPSNRRTIFKGLNFGIKTSRSTGSNTFNVYNTDFEDNVYAVNTSAHNNFNIRGCTFKIGKENVSGAPNIHEGITVFSGTGFKIDQNSFEPEFINFNDPITIGIRIKDSGSELNQIYNNNFTKPWSNNIFYANLANGLNRNISNNIYGLRYYCNENTNNISNGYDFAVTDQGISYYQGYYNKPAANTFSLGNSSTGAPTGSDFNNGAYTGNILYYYKNIVTEEPLNIYNMSKYITNSNNACIDEYDPNGSSGTGGPQSLAYLEFDLKYNTFKDSLYEINKLLENTNPEDEILEGEKLYFQDTINIICNNAIYHINNNSISFETNDKIIWLKRKQSLESEMEIIDLLIADQNISEAKIALDDISTYFELSKEEEKELQYFKSLKNLQINIINKELSIIDLYPEMLETLINIADNSKKITGDQARSILNFNGYKYFIPPVFPENINIENREESNKNINNFSKIEDIVAIPNPAISEVKFKFFVLKDGNYKIIIKNSMGNLVGEISLNNKDTNEFIWNCDKLSNGIYFYSLIKNNIVIYPSKKLLILK